jgi:hypothetical protein
MLRLNTEVWRQHNFVDSVIPKCAACANIDFWILSGNIKTVAQIHNPISHSRTKYMEQVIFFC